MEKVLNLREGEGLGRSGSGPVWGWCSDSRTCHEQSWDSGTSPAQLHGPGAPAAHSQGPHSPPHKEQLKLGLRPSPVSTCPGNAHSQSRGGRS